jgi:hypothetical protein
MNVQTTTRGEAAGIVAGARGIPGGEALLEGERPADLKAHIGMRIGSSDWVTVDQR